MHGVGGEQTRSHADPRIPRQPLIFFHPLSLTSASNPPCSVLFHPFSFSSTMCTQLILDIFYPLSLVSIMSELWAVPNRIQFLGMVLFRKKINTNILDPNLIQKLTRLIQLPGCARLFHTWISCVKVIMAYRLQFGEGEQAKQMKLFLEQWKLEHMPDMFLTSSDANASFPTHAFLFSIHSPFLRSVFKSVDNSKGLQFENASKCHVYCLFGHCQTSEPFWNLCSC